MPNASLAVKYGGSCLPNPFVTHGSTGCHPCPWPDGLTITSNCHVNGYKCPFENIEFCANPIGRVNHQDERFKSIYCTTFYQRNSRPCPYGGRSRFIEGTFGKAPLQSVQIWKIVYPRKRWSELVGREAEVI